ncbi:Regulatory protein RecX [Sterolibacterium denitrificans]|uniref:Regulatory protein RecX n=1 Tax=Sterolibacterium denitrificans TaxID=157592 RepID=A0A7Z7MUQ8_9PROT|nr:regulatory protein RecX [Sterolibacterium denitrificans]SMB23789.1 Regulatory protein RecX [Sterolibacterium denitrificans]
MKTPPQSPQVTLRALAIKLLAQREHSRAELARKLAAKAGRMGVGATPAGHTATTQPPTPPTAEDIDKVLDQLERQGLLSDTRAAQAYVRGHAARFGASRLAHSLRMRGIDAELIDASLAQEEIEDERTRAAAVWRSKFNSVPRDAREWARQARFLQGRGFAVDVIRRLLRELGKSSDLPQDAQDMETEE